MFIALLSNYGKIPNVHQVMNGLRRYSVYVCVHTHTHTRTHTHTLEYYLAMKKNEMLPFATTWMELDGIMLSEIG